MKNSIKKFSEEYFQQINQLLENLDIEKIEKIVNVLFEAYKKNKQVFILGNGGSSSNASHFACDLTKGTLENAYDDKEKRFRAISLTDNVATITAFGNDLSFEDVFFQQLRNLVSKEDIVIGISGSGNSINVIKAIQYAKKCGAKTIGLLGFKTGGKLKNLVDYEITVQDEHYGRIEGIHLMLCHFITDSLAKLKRKKRYES